MINLCFGDIVKGKNWYFSLNIQFVVRVLGLFLFFSAFICSFVIKVSFNNMLNFMIIFP